MTVRAMIALFCDKLQIGGARCAAALTDAIGNRRDDGLERDGAGHDALCQIVAAACNLNSYAMPVFGVLGAPIHDAPKTRSPYSDGQSSVRAVTRPPLYQRVRC